LADFVNERGFLSIQSRISSTDNFNIFGGGYMMGLFSYSKYNEDGSGGNDVSSLLTQHNFVNEDGSGGNDVSALPEHSKESNLGGSGGNDVS
jgi:hypothetical protein